MIYSISCRDETKYAQSLANQYLYLQITLKYYNNYNII
jgi:hypothetical protein